MKVALVHDYFFQAGGAERVMETLHEMFPRAPIFTTVVRPDTLWPRLRSADIRPSALQPLADLGIPPRALLPLYPRAIESIDLSGFDLVVSNSSAFAKGAIVGPETLHVCYCHSPMRFAWTSRQYMERERFGKATRAMLRPLLHYMRRWDSRTRHRPHVYLANSTAVARRVRETYGVAAEVVYPPVDTSRCRAAPIREDFYLIVSRLSPYKRIDRAIEAFNQLGKRLVIIGSGPDAASLARLAGPTVTLRGRLSDDEVAHHYATARGFILPGEEDFGITTLEANASGAPVIAYARGGAMDTVVDGVTGVHFHEPHASALAAAVQRAECMDWDAARLRAHAEQFGEQPFQVRMLDAIGRAVDGWRGAPTPVREIALAG